MGLEATELWREVSAFLWNHPLSFLFPSLETAELPRQDQFCLSWLVINHPVEVLQHFPSCCGTRCDVSSRGQTLLVPRDVSYGILFLLLCLRAVKWRLFSQLGLRRKMQALVPVRCGVAPKIQLYPLRHPNSRASVHLSLAALVQPRDVEIFLYLLPTFENIFSSNQIKWMFTYLQIEPKNKNSHMDMTKRQSLVAVIYAIRHNNSYNYWSLNRCVQVWMKLSEALSYKKKTLWVHNLHYFAILIPVKMIWGSHLETLQ